MSLLRLASFLLLLLLSGADSATVLPKKRTTCDTKVAHKPWGMLTDDEKSAYIDAELCLMAAPSQLDIEGTETRWDDLHWNHVVQTNFIHDTGQFLPWHRYFIVLHGNLLKDECGYNGPLPYWDETADAGLSTLSVSPVFQADAFGGNGAGSASYITDGPFVNTTLHLQRLNVAPTDYHIYRNFNISFLSGATQAGLDACFQISSYTAAWECWHGSPHAAGHGGVGGLMVDVVLSPGDPLFYLHHGWLDAMWWKWQTLDLPARLTDMGGRNVPTASYLASVALTKPGPEWTDYDGDDGNMTTLNHVLYYSEIHPNITVGEVMDVTNDLVCGEFFYSDSFTVNVMGFSNGILTPMADVS